MEIKQDNSLVVQRNPTCREGSGQGICINAIVAGQAAYTRRSTYRSDQEDVHHLMETRTDADQVEEIMEIVKTRDIIPTIAMLDTYNGIKDNLKDMNDELGGDTSLYKVSLQPSRKQ